MHNDMRYVLFFYVDEGGTGTVWCFTEVTSKFGFLSFCSRVDYFGVETWTWEIIMLAICSYSIVRLEEEERKWSFSWEGFISWVGISGISAKSQITFNSLLDLVELFTVDEL